MFTINKTLFATALVVGSLVVSAGAFAGTLSQTSATAQAGFSFDDSTHQYSRTRHVEADTGYKSGSARVTRTILSSSYIPGSYLTENGYERVEVHFDPSQVATATDGHEIMKAETLDTWQAGYARDDDGRYHLVK